MKHFPFANLELLRSTSRTILERKSSSLINNRIDQQFKISTDSTVRLKHGSQLFSLKIPIDSSRLFIYNPFSSGFAPVNKVVMN